MATLIKDYVSKLTNEEIIAILESWEGFEEKGMIGDEPIRVHTEKILSSFSGKTHQLSVVSWMRMLAFGCALVFAKKYIETLNT